MIFYSNHPQKLQTPQIARCSKIVWFSSRFTRGSECEHITAGNYRSHTDTRDMNLAFHQAIIPLTHHMWESTRRLAPYSKSPASRFAREIHRVYSPSVFFTDQTCTAHAAPCPEIRRNTSRVMNILQDYTTFLQVILLIVHLYHSQTHVRSNQIHLNAKLRYFCAILSAGPCLLMS